MLLDACKLLGAAIVIGVGVTIGKRAGKKLCNLVDGQVGDETSFMRKRLAEFRRIFDKDPTAGCLSAGGRAKRSATRSTSSSPTKTVRLGD